MEDIEEDIAIEQEEDRLHLRSHLHSHVEEPPRAAAEGLPFDANGEFVFELRNLDTRVNEAILKQLFAKHGQVLEGDTPLLVFLTRIPCFQSSSHHGQVFKGSSVRPLMTHCSVPSYPTSCHFFGSSQTGQ